jgi:hypothetical protein
MTPQEWKVVEENLKVLYHPVKLNCDGYEVTLILEQTGQFKNAIMVYIDGVVKGKWITNDCEERRRFFQPVTKSLWSTKQLASMKKLSKKMRRKFEGRSKYTYFRPYWTSFQSLKKHLIKENKEIQLLT